MIACCLSAMTLQAQNSGLQLGLKGDVQLLQPEATNQSATINNRSIGGGGALDIRYAWYKKLRGQSELGFMVGWGIGYGGYSIEGTANSSFVNTDYYGNKMNYTTDATFQQTEQYWQNDFSLLLAFRYSGFVVQIGPRFIAPFTRKRDLTVTEAGISAYYPDYGVEVNDELITGRIETPFRQTERTTANWYAIAFSIEAGWEWEIAGKSRIGLQAYCNVGTNNKYKKDSFTPFIQVEPIADTTDPVPQVTVGWADPLYTTPMYLDFGLRVYYVLPIGKL